MAKLIAVLLAAASLTGCATVPTDPAVLASRVPLDPAAAQTVATASGLRYHILRSGPSEGRPPVDGDAVVFDYEGKLLSGAVFDSSFARGEPLTGRVGQFVPGFNEALKLMRPGDDWIVWIAPALGYGAEASGPIPANSTLRFRMALRSVSPATP